MALINDGLIASAKRQLPGAFAIGTSLPHHDTIVPADSYIPRADDLRSQVQFVRQWENNPLVPRDEDGGDVEEAMGELGFEALAFYLSFHKPTFEGQWGFFYIGSRMRQFAAVLVRKLRIAPAWGLALAFEIVRRHELFHFRFDLYALHQELTLERPLYNRYHENVYRKVFCTDACYEEALANCSALLKVPQMSRAFGSPSTALSGFLRNTFKASPAGYSNFGDPLEKLRGGLGGQIITGGTGNVLDEPQSVWVGSAGPFYRQGCPEMTLISNAAAHVAAPEQRFRLRGHIWDFHRYDADPFPSQPHGHDVEDGCKLSLHNGLIYDPRTKRVIGRESLSSLRELRSRLQKKWPDVALPPLAEATATNE